MSNVVDTEAWADTAAMRGKLDAWWALQLTERRRQVLAAAGDTLPDWLAQSLIRAGLPLRVNPGFTDPSLTGVFVTPPVVAAFLAEKHERPIPKWWRHWR